MHLSQQRLLIACGAVLFLLGLLTGFAIPAFLNPRMGLASHLEGVMNGTFLIALGAVWANVSLAPVWARIAFWLLIYGSFANWVFISLAAALGTSELTPIAGKGFTGSPLAEQAVSLGLVSVGVTMVAGCALVVWGLLRKPQGAT